MKKRVILVGKAASGKDYARKICEQWLGLPYQVSYTTRPPREDETNGKDYNFLSLEEFDQMIKENKWYEYVQFNGWFYGTTHEQFNTAGGVFIMTPTGLSHVSEKERSESLVIYFEIPVDIRRNRMYERRGNADSVERRLEADHIDFLNFENYDAMITDPFFKITEMHDLIAQHIDLPNKDKIFNDIKAYKFLPN